MNKKRTISKAEHLRRSRAAKKAWRKRREREAVIKPKKKKDDGWRSEAAKKGWDTRREKKIIAQLEKEIAEQKKEIERFKARERVRTEIQRRRETSEAFKDLRKNVIRLAENEPEVVRESIRQQLKIAKEKSPEHVIARVQSLYLEFVAMDLDDEYDEGELWDIYHET